MGINKKMKITTNKNLKCYNDKFYKLHLGWREELLGIFFGGDSEEIIKNYLENNNHI